MLLRNKHGFTLIEVMTVVAIIAILMSIGIPSYLGYKPTLVLNRAVNEYHSILQQARLTAIKNRGTCSITFAVAGDSYTVSCTNSNYSRTINYDAEYGGLLVIEDQDGNPGFSANITFNSRGTCNPAYLYLTNTKKKDFYRVGTLISGVIRRQAYSSADDDWKSI